MGFNPLTVRLLVLAAAVVVVVVVGVVVFFVTKNTYETSDSSSTSNKNSSSKPIDLLALPDGFLMGSASAAYQVEGAWNESGKGENMWDRFCHNDSTKILVARNDSGDVACDSYHQYKTDVQMIKQTGFDAYRFSISWSRVLPNGTKNYVNPAGIQYYHNLIDELLANNIIPLVTIYHWDLPQPLQDLGGWTNSSIADYFSEYADLMFSEYGDKVQWWITINEPASVRVGYGSMYYAPALNDHGISDYLAVHNLLRAHGKAYKLYNEKYRSTQQGKVGITLDSTWYQPHNESSVEDMDATDRELAFQIGIFAHPIFSKEGNYPAEVRERVDKNSYAENRTQSRLPYFTDEEVEMIRGSADFFGYNNYFYSNISSGTEGEDPSFERDSGTVIVTPNAYNGVSLKNMLIWIKNEYDNPPVIVTENGCASDLGLVDTDRIEKYHAFIKGMLEAIYEEGCNVIGYTAWSIMDNFEWELGYSGKYGIWQVDFSSDNRTRAMKHSAYWFKTMLSKRRLINTTDYELS